MTRRFDLAWPPWQPPTEAGMVVLASDIDATFGWARAHLGKDDGGVYAWTAADSALEPMKVVQRPGVVAATLVPAWADVRRAGLALQVSTWLAERGSNEAVVGYGVGAHLTSYTPPLVPSGAVRIPHLVTVHRGEVTTDAVVWELAPATALRCGGELPDLGLVERRLPELLRLRAAARRGRLPMSPAAQRLAGLLAGRDLHIELVYEHLDLLRVLLGDSRERQVL